MKNLIIALVLVSSLSGETLFTTANSLNLRLDPNLQGKVLKVLSRGTEVESLTLSKGEYIFVKVEGINGWVHKNYLSRSSSQVESFIEEAYKYLDVQYIWGGTTPRGFDCSGFIKYALEQSLKVEDFPRVSYQQANYREKRIALEDIKRGDILFFDTAKQGRINHCAIYLGNEQFIHATSAKHLQKVTITELKPFYRKSFKWAIRI